MKLLLLSLLSLATVQARFYESYDQRNCNDKDFDVLRHLGANSPWFAGPNVFDISPEVPEGCTVDQAAYIVRHGSRYPDQGAYNEWNALYQKLRSSNFTATSTLSFLPTWSPVLSDPAQQIAELSPGGYSELSVLGSTLRTRYPSLYAYNTPFHLWANAFPRTIDSARLFARGFLGPNSTMLGTVYAISSSHPSAVGNSLATSDSCPTFKDSSGSAQTSVWEAKYLPPIVSRINKLVKGLVFTPAEVALMPYLCGFESQILMKRSPWCGVWKEDEIEKYEYRQDLRYWYGTGLGAGRNASVMLPVLQGVVDLFVDGPREEVPRLAVAFTHDNQINELVAVSGVFDGVRALDPERMDGRRIFRSSNNNPMRGTVAFERISCGTSNSTSVRILLNDADYPVPGCDSGPGRSCPLEQYAELVTKKFDEAGSFAEICGVPDESVTKSNTGGVTFFKDLSLGSLNKVTP